MASDTSLQGSQNAPVFDMSLEELPQETPIIMDTPIDYALPRLLVEGQEISPILRAGGSLSPDESDIDLREQMLTEKPDHDVLDWNYSDLGEDSQNEEDPVSALQRGVKSVTFKVDQGMWTRDDKAGQYGGARPKDVNHGNGLLGTLTAAVSTMVTTVSTVGSSLYSTVKMAVSETAYRLDDREAIGLPPALKPRRPTTLPIPLTRQPRPSALMPTGMGMMSMPRLQQIDRGATAVNQPDFSDSENEQIRQFKMGEWLMKTPTVGNRAPVEPYGAEAAPTSRLVWSGPEPSRPPVHPVSRIQEPTYSRPGYHRTSRQEAWQQGISYRPAGLDTWLPRRNSLPERYLGYQQPGLSHGTAGLDTWLPRRNTSLERYQGFQCQGPSQSDHGPFYATPLAMEPPSRPPGISPMRHQDMTRPSPHTGMPDMDMDLGLRHLQQSFASLNRQYPYQGLHDAQRWHSDPPPPIPDYITPRNTGYGPQGSRAMSSQRPTSYWDLTQLDPYQGVTGNTITPRSGAGVPVSTPADTSPVRQGRDHSPGGISSVSAPVTQEAHRWKPKKAANFDGKTSWKDFHVQFEMVASLNGWDEGTKALELATSLRGTAQSILTDLEPEKRIDYTSLVSALSARFEPDDQADVYLAQIRSRTRKKSESLPELGQEMKRLARHALPLAPAEVREWLALTHFMEALEDEFIEYAVKQAKPKTVDEAVKAAVEIEAFRLSRRRRLARKDTIRMQRLDPPTMSSSDPSNNSRSKSKLHEKSKPGRHEGKSSDNTNSQWRGPKDPNPTFTWPQPGQDTDRAPTGQGRNFDISQRSCFGCGIKGHMIKDCTVVCERCHRRGHTESSCRTERCDYCGKLYHSEKNCHKKLRDLVSKDLGNEQ